MKHSEYLEKALAERLGHPVTQVERTYHTLARSWGHWVYAWTFKIDGHVEHVGCYETMQEVVKHLRAGGTVKIGYQDWSPVLELIDPS